MDQRMDEKLFQEIERDMSPDDLPDVILETKRSREAEIELSGKCASRSEQIEKLLNSNSDLLDVIIKKGKEYTQLQTEFNQLKRDNANLEKIVQSWKDACTTERKLVEGKTKTIKKLRSEIEECKGSAHYGR